MIIINCLFEVSGASRSELRSECVVCGGEKLCIDCVRYVGTPTHAAANLIIPLPEDELSP